MSILKKTAAQVLDEFAEECAKKIGANKRLKGRVNASPKSVIYTEKLLLPIKKRKSTRSPFTYFGVSSRGSKICKNCLYRKHGGRDAYLKKYRAETEEWRANILAKRLGRARISRKRVKKSGVSTDMEAIDRF